MHSGLEALASLMQIHCTGTRLHTETQLAGLYGKLIDVVSPEGRITFSQALPNVF